MHRALEQNHGDSAASAPSHSHGLSRRSLLVAGASAAAAALSTSVLGESKFRRVPTQYIAALGLPGETAGNHAERWGLWRKDPGPRGVRLDRYDRLQAADGVAPAGWQFDGADWWLEEHGLIMERPEFPLPPGEYMVTGAREVTSVLTVAPMAADGTQRWSLADGATIHDVTHLRCRSARYTPASGNDACSPTRAERADFPVAPGAEMPPVAQCNKQGYAVLIVIGMAVENG